MHASVRGILFGEGEWGPPDTDAYGVDGFGLRPRHRVYLEALVVVPDDLTRALSFAVTFRVMTVREVRGFDERRT